MTEQKALEIVKLRKKEAEEKHRLFLDTLRKDDEFDTLWRDGISLKWDYIKARGEEEKNNIQALIDKNEKSINKYLSEKSYPRNAIKIPYSCALCNDTGYRDGVLCSCVEKIRLKNALSENPILQGKPFGIGEIDFSYYKEQSEQKKKYANMIKSALDNGKKIFLIAGKAGTGKTFFACSAVNGELKNGKDVLALNSVKLNKLFLDYHCAPMERKREIWDKLNAEVLLIDDLGAEQMLNNVTIPYLLELLTDRTDKLTFITTNLSPMDLDKRYGERIVSRLLDKKLSLPILFDGKDLRF